MKIKILVATHQPLAIIESDIFHPIQIGFDVQKPLIKNTYLNDNSGLNISKKNPIFNELTALYWAWKNLDADVVGLAHYRRYLDLTLCCSILGSESAGLFHHFSFEKVTCVLSN